MTVGAPKGKTVAEPAPTKRDAVPRGAGAPGGFPGALRTPSATEDSARAHPHLHHQTGHVGQRGGQAVSFGHRVTVTQELQLGWGEADFTGTTQAHGPVQRPGGMPPALTPSGTPPPSSSKGNEMAETHENKDGGGNQTASDGDAARRARTQGPGARGDAVRPEARPRPGWRRRRTPLYRPTQPAIPRRTELPPRLCRVGERHRPHPQQRDPPLSHWAGQAATGGRGTAAGSRPHGEAGTACQAWGVARGPSSAPHGVGSRGAPGP